MHTVYRIAGIFRGYKCSRFSPYRENLYIIIINSSQYYGFEAKGVEVQLLVDVRMRQKAELNKIREIHLDGFLLNVAARSGIQWSLHALAFNGGQHYFASQWNGMHFHAFTAARTTLRATCSGYSQPSSALCYYMGTRSAISP